MKKLSRKVFGTLAACALLPFYAVAWIFHGVAAALRDFREFAGDFVKSLTDPEHAPSIGLKGFYELRECRRKAYRAEAEYDDQEALENWKKCAFYFDTDAMLKLAEHYRLSGDDESDGNNRTRASEWYAVAASFGNTKGESGYVGMTGGFLADGEKQWLRRNYIKNRKQCLRD